MSEVGKTNAFPEYELSGIENIVRGVCIQGGKVLLCRAKGGSSTYLPGGHIEFGETSREALKREMREETGREIEIGDFLGVVENQFQQHGKPHAEINLVYSMAIIGGVCPHEINALEDWIEFEWCPLENLEEANLLPYEMRALSKKVR